MKPTIGQRISSLRKSHGLKQEELAEKLTIDRASLSFIENDKRELKAEELIQLAKTFNISVDELLNVHTPFEVILEGPEKLQKSKATMRVSVPSKNLKKSKEVPLYLLGKVRAKPNIGQTALEKPLNVIDFDYYEKYEEQLIGATYIKNQHGPTPIEFRKIVEQMIQNKELEVVHSEYFKFQQKKYLPRREPDLSVVSANELLLIDDVLQKLSGMNAATISEYSHKDVPWVVTPMLKKIDYETVFYRTSPYSVRDYSDDEIL